MTLVDSTVRLGTASATTELQPKYFPATLQGATPLKHVGRKGPVPKRRYQEGLLKIENGYYYSFFYQDRTMPDGTTGSMKVRFNLGKVDEISKLSASREHGRLRDQINRERGSVPTAPKGETFKAVADQYWKMIGQYLSPGTGRQRKSHLTAHLIPTFGESALMALDFPTLQGFVNERNGKIDRKTIINILDSFYAVLDYAKKCNIRFLDIPRSSLSIPGNRQSVEAPYFRPEVAERIFTEAREPYKTVFRLAWVTALRAGELLGLKVCNVDLERKIIQPRSQADDRTRVLRELKTSNSNSPVAITLETSAMLAEYLKNNWRLNPSGLLFSNRSGRPLKRAYVVKFGLHPILVKLGLPTKGVGLHAFRHGLGTALAEGGVQIKTVQQILRHRDMKTTVRFYVHSDMDAQRAALAGVSIGTNVPVVQK